MMHFSEWLAGTNASMTIQEQLWIIPLMQTIHILAIAMVLSSVGMIDLKILGLAGSAHTLLETSRRFAPWIWTSLIVLLLSGFVLIVGEPVRELGVTVFWIKMGLLAVAAASTAAFHLSLQRHAAFWEDSRKARGLIKASAIIVFAVWCAVVVAGRWIAYSQLSL